MIFVRISYKKSLGSSFVGAWADFHWNYERSFRNFSLYSLTFCPTFSSQASKFGNFQLTSLKIWKLLVHKIKPPTWKFSVHKPLPCQRQISLRKPHTSEIRGAHPYLKRINWVPSSPTPSFGHPNVRAVISLSSNYCARKGVIKEHRTVFFNRVTVKKKKKIGDKNMQCSCCLSWKINPQRVRSVKFHPILDGSMMYRNSYEWIS